jgi:hypothetical protein
MKMFIPGSLPGLPLLLAFLSFQGLRKNQNLFKGTMGLVMYKSTGPPPELFHYRNS